MDLLYGGAILDCFVVFKVVVNHYSNWRKPK